jgi:hypothetical protein
MDRSSNQPASVAETRHLFLYLRVPRLKNATPFPMTQEYPMSLFSRSTRLLGFSAIASLFAVTLAACGGGGDAGTATADAGGSGGGGGAGTVAAAPLVISAATPGSRNGTLTPTAGAIEHGSSNAGMTTYQSADPYCRIGAYTLNNSGDSTAYYIELSFKKDSKAIGLVKFGLDSAISSTEAQLTGPVTGMTVDISNRRIGFANVVLTGTGTSLTLNGALDFPTNVDAGNRASCG